MSTTAVNDGLIRNNLESFQLMPSQQVRKNYVYSQILFLVCVILLSQVNISRNKWIFVTSGVFIYLYQTISYNSNVYEESAFNIIQNYRLKNLNLATIQESLSVKNISIKFAYHKYILYLPILSIIAYVIYININDISMLNSTIGQYIPIKYKIITISIIGSISILLGLLIIKYKYSEIQRGFDISMWAGMKKLGIYTLGIITFYITLFSILHILLWIFKLIWIDWLQKNTIKVSDVLPKMIADIFPNIDLLAVLVDRLWSMVSNLVEQIAIFTIFTMLIIGLVAYGDVRRDDILSLQKVRLQKFELYYIFQFLQLLVICCILDYIFKYNIVKSLISKISDKIDKWMFDIFVGLYIILIILNFYYSKKGDYVNK